MLDVPVVSMVASVVDALVAGFGAIASDPAYGPLQVVDGPAYQTQVLNLLAVGVGQPAVAEQLIPQNRGNAYDEAFDVSCLTWAWSASRVMKAHRDRCTVVLTAVRDIVDAQPLADVSLSMGRQRDWTHSTAGEGSSCAVQFSIHAVASI